MFKRIEEPKSEAVSLVIEGKTISAASGDTVAAAMLLAGFDHTRITQISGSRRAPFCMMGVCFDCLVEIDGEPNQQACQTLVREGMQVRLQRGIRDLKE